MRSKITYGLVVIGIAISLNSCYTVSTIETDVLLPAKRIFPQDVYRIGVVSRMDADVQSNDEKFNKSKKIAFERDSILLKTAVLALLDGLSESPRFEAYYITPRRTLKGDDASLSNPLKWNHVKRLARKDSLDLLISLDAANFKDTVYRRGDEKRSELPNIFRGGSQIMKDIKAEGLYQAYIIFPHLYWRFYDLRSGQVKEQVYVDTMFYPSAGNRGYPSKEKSLKLYYESLGDAAYNYSHELAPYWATEGRAWYPDGDTYFIKAAKLANDGNWAEASEIWLKMTELENKKIASKACLNMAVSAEMQDRLDLALMWVERAEELGLKYYPKHYKEVLEKRIKTRELLDIQMK